MFGLDDDNRLLDDESHQNQNSCDSCGWIAAFLSMLAFGSFGVPIKMNAAAGDHTNIDPLVFQTYKTFMCFVTSWLVLFTQDFQFSAWGIVSGLFWVPGGWATVYAIQHAGLAIGIGMGSSFIVLVSFVWGIFVFDEAVHSRAQACFAVFCMMMGLLGMAHFSSPTTRTTRRNTISTATASPNNASMSIILDGGNSDADDDDQSAAYRTLVSATSSEDDDDDDRNTRTTTITTTATELSNSEHNGNAIVEPAAPTQPYHDNPSSVVEPLSLTEAEDQDADHHEPSENDGIFRLSSSSSGNMMMISQDDDADDDYHRNHHHHDNNNNNMTDTHELVCGRKVSKRTLGMLAAMFITGVWGGSIMAPMKFIQTTNGDSLQGTHYLLSFSIGASLVCVCFWIIRWLYNAYRLNNNNNGSSLRQGYEALPSFHVRTMWRPGCLCGLLWSIGNYFSLISVYYLGEGVGYPLVQTSILVSGLWGIFFFQEIKGRRRILQWLGSSLLTIFGILLLSYEHSHA